MITFSNENWKVSLWVREWESLYTRASLRAGKRRELCTDGRGAEPMKNDYGKVMLDSNLNKRCYFFMDRDRDPGSNEDDIAKKKKKKQSKACAKPTEGRTVRYLTPRKVMEVRQQWVEVIQTPEAGGSTLPGFVQTGEKCFHVLASIWIILSWKVIKINLDSHQRWDRCMPKCSHMCESISQSQKHCWKVMYK